MIQLTVRVSIIMDWLGCEGLHFVQTLPDDKQEICKSSAGPFSECNVKFKLQHHATPVVGVLHIIQR